VGFRASPKGAQRVPTKGPDKVSEMGAGLGAVHSKFVGGGGTGARKIGKRSGSRQPERRGHLRGGKGRGTVTLLTAGNSREDGART